MKGRLKIYLSLLQTLFTLGWKGDFYVLRNCALVSRNKIAKFLYHVYIKRRSCYIPLECHLGDKIEFSHLNGIFISCDAVIGDGCRIFQNVTIGSNYAYGTKKKRAPHIGENVLIGANTSIVGGCVVANNVKIGAGCVIADDILEEGVTVVMNKPRIIKKK